jgi:hypothetical protein
MKRYTDRLEELLCVRRERSGSGNSKPASIKTKPTPHPTPGQACKTVLQPGDGCWPFGVVPRARRASASQGEAGQTPGYTPVFELFFDATLHSCPDQWHRHENRGSHGSDRCRELGDLVDKPAAPLLARSDQWYDGGDNPLEGVGKGKVGESLFPISHPDGP